jgi:ketosteroid isomerase-like protein
METYISISKEWSPEQKELWEKIEDHWNCLVTQQVDKFLDYIHPDFVGFGHESPYPVDYEWLKNWIGFWSKNTIFLTHSLRPLHIVMHDGGIAVVQYCLFIIAKNDVSAGTSSIRRYTMVWKKENKKWRVIASHNNLQNS